MRIGLLGWGMLWLSFAAPAESLRIGFSTHKPPYVFQGEPRGLEYEIVASAARRAGLHMEAYYAPMERLHLMLRRGDIEAIATTSERSGVAAFYSDVYIHYHNFAVALARRRYVIRRIADLDGYSISAFQRARFLLGGEFQAMAERNPRYREEAQQIARNRLLYTGRIEVIVGDSRIINYFNREVAEQVDTRQPLTWYDLFPPTPYQVGFRLRAQRDLFNQGLEALRKDGEYRAIESKYAEY